MGNAHGHSSRRITEVDKAILDLKVQKRNLEIRFQNLCELIEKERTVAKELVVVGKRDRALLALKRAKLQDSSKENCERWIHEVDEMLNSIEKQTSFVHVLDALRQGNKAMKGIQEQICLEDVEILMEDTAEAREYQQQLEELVHGEDIDCEEDLAELEDLITIGERQMIPSPPLEKPITKILSAESNAEAIPM